MAVCVKFIVRHKRYIHTFVRMAVKNVSNIGRYLKPGLLILTKVFVISILTLGKNAYCQPETSFHKDLSESFFTLFKDYSLKNQVSLRQNGIFIFAADAKGNLSSRPEAAVYWDEAPLFLRYMRSSSMQSALEMYRQKGVKNFATTFLFAINVVPPSASNVTDGPLKGYRIALDPGHFAHNFETAKMERKYVRLRASDMNIGKDIELFEAKLTSLTAEILKDKLEKLGAEVMVTRKEHTSATGKNFDEWYRDDFYTALETDLRYGLIDSNEYHEYKKDASSKLKTLRGFFTRHELRVRADKINAFQPDLTIIIHYNVGETNVPDKDGYHRPHDQNISMMFVGGAYAKNELSTPLDRLQFLRQALSDDVENSVHLSALVQKYIIEDLKVPVINTAEHLPGYIANYSIASNENGVYHRNLALTRMVYGTIAFGEPLMQDNREEALRLSTDDCSWNGKKVPCRLVEMAGVYEKAILEYVKQRQ